MATDAILHPDFKDQPYWWEAAAPTALNDADPPAHADVLIVGGGYSGLSAALELARAGRSVVVAEAELFGHGASSRNGGGVSAGVNLGKGIAGGSSKSGAQSEIAKRLDALMGESRAAFDLVGTLVEREKIDCHYENADASSALIRRNISPVSKRRRRHSTDSATPARNFCRGTACARKWRAISITAV